MRKNNKMIISIAAACIMLAGVGQHTEYAAALSQQGSKTAVSENGNDSADMPINKASDLSDPDGGGQMPDQNGDGQAGGSLDQNGDVQPDGSSDQNGDGQMGDSSDQNGDGQAGDSSDQNGDIQPDGSSDQNGDGQMGDSSDQNGDGQAGGSSDQNGDVQPDDSLNQDIDGQRPDGSQDEAEWTDEDGYDTDDSAENDDDWADGDEEWTEPWSGGDDDVDWADAKDGIGKDKNEDGTGEADITGSGDMDLHDEEEVYNEENGMSDLFSDSYYGEADESYQTGAGLGDDMILILAVVCGITAVGLAVRKSLRKS